MNSMQFNDWPSCSFRQDSQYFRSVWNNLTDNLIVSIMDSGSELKDGRNLSKQAASEAKQSCTKFGLGGELRKRLHPSQSIGESSCSTTLVAGSWSSPNSLEAFFLKRCNKCLSRSPKSSTSCCNAGEQPTLLTALVNSRRFLSSRTMLLYILGDTQDI